MLHDADRTSSRRRVALVAALLCGLLVAGCGVPAVSRSDAGVLSVTAYDHVSPSRSSSGAVTATLSGAQSARLRALLRRLPAAPGGSCEEDSVLFRITFTPAGPGDHAWRATGDVCPGTLRMAGAGPIGTRGDRDCAFLRFLGGLFPGREASGTKSYLYVCSQHD